MSRTLYLIVSHTNPAQVIRLVKTIRLNSPDSYVLIHHDYSSSVLDRSVFQQMDNVHVLEEYIPVTWGQFSLVEMELYCINWVLARAIPFDWLVLLSGQDYPIKPLSEIEQLFKTTEYDGFMEYFPATMPPVEPTEFGLRWKQDTGLKRFFYRHYRLPSNLILNRVFFKLGRIFNKKQSLITVSADRNGSRLGIRCTSTPFSKDFPCYAGSQWHTLSYRCVQYIHGFVQQHPEFVKHYRRTVIPDESFFQTILLNNRDLKIFNNNQRYITWDGSGPALLKVKDFDYLINSDRQFARKFNTERDREILDLLDQYFLQYTLNKKMHGMSQTSTSIKDY